MARLKGRLIAKDYSQAYGVNYSDTFSLIVKLTYVWSFISIAAFQNWPLRQLDIKNAFFHDYLLEKVYIEQLLEFVAQEKYEKVYHLKKSLYSLKQTPRAWFGKFGEVMLEFGLKKSKHSHSVFHRQSIVGTISLVVYVDDIVIIRCDYARISSLKSFLHTKFHTKDLSQLKYLLRIKVTRSKKEIMMFQMKYVLNILVKTGKPCNTLVVPNIHLHKMILLMIRKSTND